MRMLLIAALVLCAAVIPARADTLRVAYMDGEGRICRAELAIDDGTGHVVSIHGTDYEGRAYSYAFEPFSVEEFKGCGSRLTSYSRGGYWYHLGRNEAGVVCSISRMGGPGYSSAQYVYRFSDPDAGDEGSAAPVVPEHN